MLLETRAAVAELVERARDALGDRLQQHVARRMPEQVVNLLEAIEIKTKHGETLPGCEGGLDFLIQLHVEA